MTRCWSVFLLLALALFFSSCVTKDSDHRIVVSVADQSLELYHKETLLGRYPISTSRFGLGDRPGSRATPLGRMEVAIKIGAGAPLGAVFKSRRRTGEVLVPNAPGRDPIVTRILWLKGLEPQNRHAFARCIYIHGTPEERNVGRPASFGCVRMKSVDMLRVFNVVGVGATVEIIPGSLPDSLAPANNPHVVSGPIASQAPPLPVAQAAVVSGSIPVPAVVAPVNSDKKPGS
jgi:L,D-transpeptidase catalytic domain